jgi:prolyl-tRNA synthetase
VIIIPIPYKESEGKVEAYAKEVYGNIKKAGFRVQLDDREKTPGEKFFYWEMFGVPVRVEVGPRDLKERRVTILERSSLKRSSVDFNKTVSVIKEMLNTLTENLLKKSRSALKEMTVTVRDIDALKNAIEDKKIARVCWCEKVGCAETIKEESGGEIRGHRIDIEEKPDMPCIVCGKKAEKVVYVAKAY